MVYPQITLKTAAANRVAAAAVYLQYKAPFLETVSGAKSQELLMRDENVQVLHGLDTVENGNVYLKSVVFTADVVGGLQPPLEGNPDI